MAETWQRISKLANELKHMKVNGTNLGIHWVVIRNKVSHQELCDFNQHHYYEIEISEKC